MKSSPFDMLGSVEAADILRVSDRRVRQLAVAGRLGQRVSGRYLFSRAEVERFARARRQRKKKVV
jgi:excisionase family DNA binding protein